MNELKIMKEMKEIYMRMNTVIDERAALNYEYGKLCQREREIKKTLNEIEFSKRDLSGTCFDKNVDFFQDSEAFKSKAEMKRYFKAFCGEKCAITKTFINPIDNAVAHTEYKPGKVLWFTEVKVTFEDGAFNFYNDIKKARKTKNGIKIETQNYGSTTRIYIEIVD